MPKIVQEFVPESFSFMCAGDKASNVKELYGYTATAANTGAIVRFATIGKVMSCAGTVDLEVADCSLGVYRCETKKAFVQDCLIGSFSQKRGLREIACARISAASSWSTWFPWTDRLSNSHLSGYCDRKLPFLTVEMCAIPVECG